jgi:hypothetical protein
MRTREVHWRLVTTALVGAVFGTPLDASVLMAQTSASAVQPAPPPTDAPAPAVAGPAVRRIESASAVSIDTIGAISQVRALSGGRLLLNDGTRRRLLLLDSTLKIVRVVLDSLTDVENAYGTRPGTIIGYRGDSTLFIDPATYAMLVIDGDGKIVRVRSVPRAQDVTYQSGSVSSYGIPGFDGQGRLVYRYPAQAARPTVAPRSDVPYFPSPPDSAFIVGIHLDTRRVDTLGTVRAPKTVYSFVRSEYGFEIRSASNPLPLIDEWAVLSDGTVACVRGRDYRSAYLNPDGTSWSSEKLPFPWTRMTDDDKMRFADSAKAAQTKSAQNDYVMQMIAWSNLLNKPYPKAFTVHEGFELPPGLPRDWILPKSVLFPSNYSYACAVVVPGAPSPGPALVPPASGIATQPPCRPSQFSTYYGNGYTPPAPAYRAPTFIPASELPDYKPPLTNGAVRADADDNLWIRPVQLKPVPGGPIYDIVNRQGKLADRIQLPPGYTIAGFAPGKVVYLSMRDASGLHLARVRLR